MKDIRVGFGYDFHELCHGSYLNLAGLKIESDYTIDSHSDGDIILHAISDAIYGSLASGDIGTHFPSNESTKNIKSCEIIQHACKLLHNESYVISNVDVTIVLEKPYLQTKIYEMRKSLSNLISLDINKISIKSSTSQKIGLIGTCKAVACYASILIIK